jgi:sigma-B regulation protein RsbU (phosphoserine phosphatase)
MKLPALSLRNKFMLFAMSLPMVSIVLSLVLAVDVFKKDKIAYIFDSSLAVSKAKASNIQMTLEEAKMVARNLAINYEPQSRSLSENGVATFNMEQKILSVSLFESKSTDPDAKLERLLFLQKGDQNRPAPTLQLTKSISNELKADGVSLIHNDLENETVQLLVSLSASTDTEQILSLVEMKDATFSAAFKQQKPYSSFLMRANGEPIAGSSNKEMTENSAQLKSLWDILSNSVGNESTIEFANAGGDESLASFVRVASSGMSVISVVPKAEAFVAVQSLIHKTFLFFCVIALSTIIISVLASRRLTAALGILYDATTRVASGDFNVNILVKTRDEVGALANSFNLMTKEVARLVVETAQKARMENELETAKTVQATLFPPNNATLGPMEISGYYQPASECGGDWWFYSEDSERVYIWIGDATGHGAPAALLTSAARAVVSVIEFEDKAISAARAFGILNHAINKTSKGQIMMTFFLAIIDKKSGLMTYANASHEPPMLLHATDTPPTRDDFQYLNEVNNPRLGQDIQGQFQETTVQLKDGDQIVFYTDGVYDIVNLEDKKFGERKFAKLLSQVLIEKQSTEIKMRGIIEELETYRRGTALADDVTVIICKYKKA